MAGFTIPRAFVSMDPWSGTLLVGMPRGVTLPDGRDVGGYSLRKYADEREKTDWRGEEAIRVTLDDGFPARLQRGRGDDVEAVFVDASVLADAVKTRLDSALRAAEDMDWTPDFGFDEFELKTFEVTVYHPDLLPSESAAALGDPVRSGVAPAWRPGMADIPYASYRVRPDMIVDGCVVVAGTYGDCGTPFDGRCLMSVDVSDWTEEERAAWTEAFPADPVFPSLPDMFGDDYGRCR